MTRQVPASLLKVLGEAADGYRTGEAIYIAASYNFPHELEVFEDEQDAEAYVQQSDKTPDWGVFGPYVTNQVERLTAGTDYEILSIKVSIRKNGKEEEIEIDPKESDLLVWSESAMDKFIYPYYVQLYGIEAVSELKLLGLARHDRKTRWLPA